jgi:hypothetical protein
MACLPVYGHKAKTEPLKLNAVMKKKSYRGGKQNHKKFNFGKECCD